MSDAAAEQASDPYGPDGVNLNLVLRQTPSDPVSGRSSLRASLCEVAPARTPVVGQPPRTRAPVRAMGVGRQPAAPVSSGRTS